MKKPSKETTGLIAIAAVFMTLGVTCFQPKPAAAKQEVAPPPVNPTALVAPVKTGVKDALERQLEDNPSIAAKDEQFRYPGDLKDPIAVKKWAKNAAALLATETGYEDYKFGAHITASAPGKWACVIKQSPTGKLQVVEYIVVIPPPPPPQFSQTAVREAAPSAEASRFLGDTQKKLPSYQTESHY